MVRTLKGYDARYPLRLSDELKSMCESVAAAEKISLNDWIVKVLTEAADGENEKLRQMIGELREKNFSLCLDLEARKGDLEVLKGELGARRRELEAVREEFEAVRGELEVTGSQLGAVRAELEAKKAELALTRNFFESVNNMHSADAETINNLIRRIDGLEREIYELKK